jgi:hypothetical protein
MLAVLHSVEFIPKHVDDASRVAKALTNLICLQSSILISAFFHGTQVFPALQAQPQLFFSSFSLSISTCIFNELSSSRP